MRKYCYLCLTVLLLACVASPAGAATFTYSDSTGTLRPLPSGWPPSPGNCFFPTDALNAPIGSGSIVTIDYTTAVDPNMVFGGTSNTGDSGNNILTIKNTNSAIDAAHGGLSLTGNSSSNIVRFTGGTIDQMLIGGRAMTTGSAENNTVTVDGGTVNDNTNSTICGGRSNGGLVKNNKVFIISGTVKGINIYGGNGETTEENHVEISGSNPQQVYAGYSNNGRAYKNTAKITTGIVTNMLVAGYSLGTGLVSENIATIESGGAVHNIVGGHATKGIAEKNEVYVTGGNVRGGAMGGVGNAVTARIQENTVFVSGGTVKDVYGGYNYQPGSVTKNTVELSGGTVTNRVAGGALSGAGGAIRDNVVKVKGNVDLQSARLMGSLGGVTTTGNTLEAWVPFTAKGLTRFQKYSFFLQDAAKDGDTIITVTNGTGEGTPTAIDIAGTIVEVGIPGSSSALNKGDSINLIKETGGYGIAGSPEKTTGVGMQGFALQYDFDLEVQNGDTLVAIVTKAESNKGGDNGGNNGGGYLNPRTKSLLEGQIASASFVGQGLELTSGQGIASAMSAAQSAGANTLAAFASVSGGQSRYHSGSHVDVNGVSLITGVGKNFALNNGSAGNLLTSAFFEAGFGSYDSYNSFRTIETIKGKGNTSYRGGGILARYDSPVGLYVETSGRVGKVKNEYSSKNYRNGEGRRAHYDSEATYYGAHGGLGYIYQISKPASLDMYSKYMWTRQEGDSVRMDKDTYRFKAVDSHRSRTGARVSYDIAPESAAKVAVYAGAAFEYEFNGKSRGSVRGMAIDAPSTKGGTGMGELGVSLKPVRQSGFSMDLGFQGYTGKREGVTGNLQLKFEF